MENRADLKRPTRDRSRPLRGVLAFAAVGAVALLANPASAWEGYAGTPGDAGDIIRRFNPQSNEWIICIQITSNGQPVAGADVKVTSPPPLRTGPTDQNGFYCFKVPGAQNSSPLVKYTATWGGTHIVAGGGT